MNLHIHPIEVYHLSWRSHHFALGRLINARILSNKLEELLWIDGVGVACQVKESRSCELNRHFSMVVKDFVANIHAVCLQSKHFHLVLGVEHTD